MPFLRLDHYSSYDNSRLYGLKGEVVKVISDHGGALIVETASGVKIPVNKRDISDEWPPKGDYVPKPAPIKNIVPAKKTSRKSAPLDDRPNLFNI